MLIDCMYTAACMMSTHIEFRGSYFRSTQPIHENTNFAPCKNFPLYIMVIDHRVSIYTVASKQIMIPTQLYYATCTCMFWVCATMVDWVGLTTNMKPLQLHIQYYCRTLSKLMCNTCRRVQLFLTRRAES